MDGTSSCVHVVGKSSPHSTPLHLYIDCFQSQLRYNFVKERGKSIFLFHYFKKLILTLLLLQKRPQLDLYISSLFQSYCVSLQDSCINPRYLFIFCHLCCVFNFVCPSFLENIDCIAPQIITNKFWRCGIHDDNQPHAFRCLSYYPC